jgi:hypothetical protein
MRAVNAHSRRALTSSGLLGPWHQAEEQKPEAAQARFAKRHLRNSELFSLIEIRTNSAQFIALEEKKRKRTSGCPAPSMPVHGISAKSRPSWGSSSHGRSENNWIDGYRRRERNWDPTFSRLPSVAERVAANTASADPDVRHSALGMPEMAPADRPNARIYS